MKVLSIDIGTNSVGSCWVDMEQEVMRMGVSVFPAGVEESSEGRGAPKNQARRGKRSSRRIVQRRAQRKRWVREVLAQGGLLPKDAEERRMVLGPYRKGEECEIEKWNPWVLRREGLRRELDPFEFGRVLVHLNQRRGALGFDTQADEEGEVKAAIDHVRVELLKRYGEGQERERLLALHESEMEEEDVREEDRGEKSKKGKEGRFSKEFAKWMEQSNATFGRMMADAMEERRVYFLDSGGNPKKNRKGENRWYQHKPVRNRRDSFEFHADRALIHDEFEKLWARQKSYGGELACLLSADLRRQLDDPSEDGVWRHKGAIFGQRRTYWDIGSLGRCDLEPTDRCAPIADMHAQQFRVIETVNNIRIREEGQAERVLTGEEREKVINLLRGPLGKKRKGKSEAKESASVTDIRKALGLKARDKSVRLNLEEDEERKINTDWFYREIVHGAIGVQEWERMDDHRRESINRGILKFEPSMEKHQEKLRRGAVAWWGLPVQAADKLVEAWKRRGELGKRVRLSRRAIRNLLPYMNRFEESKGHWPTQVEARIAFSEDPGARDATTGAAPDEKARRRYASGTKGINAASRYYMRQGKHQIRGENGAVLAPLPPAPMVSNPVVRKAIHQVRAHIMAYLRKFGCKPDRIVIEYFRGIKGTAKQGMEQLKSNRKREGERKAIEENLKAWGIPRSNWGQAVFRVRMCKEQKGICPLSIGGPNDGRNITELMAAEGRDVEIAHIIPESITGRTMDFNNVVLCFRDANRNQGARTPVDWLGPSGLKEVLRRLEKTDVRRNKVKWKRLQMKTPDAEEYRSAQATDTAYAARQVAAYLQSALYEGEADGKRHIFATKGEYTARLRADWGLHESEIDRESGLEPAAQAQVDAEELKEDPDLLQRLRRARKDPTKDRVDHRHHALDALVNAFTPELVSILGEQAGRAREYREKHGRWPRRLPITPPWGMATEQFRAMALSALNKLVVTHVPAKRRLTGALHEDNPCGQSKKYDGLYVIHKPVTDLAPAHFTKPELPKKGPRTWRIPGKGQNQAIGSGGMRVALRACLERGRVRATSQDFAQKEDDQKKEACALLAEYGCLVPAPNLDDSWRTISQWLDTEKPALVVDLERFPKRKNRKEATKQKKAFALAVNLIHAHNGFVMRSGVPIKGLTLLLKLNDPIVIERDGVKRFYRGGNNHHIEILEHAKTGKWSGETISMYQAAQRNIERLRALKKAGVPPARELRKMQKGERGRYAVIVSGISREYPIVNRAGRDGKKFVMSLAEGEMIYGRRWDGKTKRPIGRASYHVVAKLDDKRIFFATHWDARRADAQERWAVSGAGLRACGPEDNTPPAKVWVSPLGEVRFLQGD